MRSAARTARGPRRVRAGLGRRPRGRPWSGGGTVGPALPAATRPSYAGEPGWSRYVRVLRGRSLRAARRLRRRCSRRPSGQRGGVARGSDRGRSPDEHVRGGGHVVIVPEAPESARAGPSAYQRCFNRAMSRGLRALTAIAGGAVLGTVALTGVGPALGSPSGGEEGGVIDPNAHPGAVRAQITFVKKPAHPWNSRISWEAKRQQADGTWKVVASQSWRAGSGLPGGSATNPCVKGHGWLPNGRYS